MTNRYANAALTTIIFFTGDMARLADFYAGTLDLGEPNLSPGHMGYDLGNIYLGFDQVADPQKGGSMSVWFEVDDLDAVFERFVARDAAIRYPPTDKPWGARLASLRDPDGNIFGLAQRR
jgi:predicted enzyme related to lactoylglutathione lyase